MGSILKLSHKYIHRNTYLNKKNCMRTLPPYALQIAIGIKNQLGKIQLVLIAHRIKFNSLENILEFN